MIDLFMKEKNATSQWFRYLRTIICQSFEKIEQELTGINADKLPGKFKITSWNRDGMSGGGEMGIMRGRVFEKVGVNFSSIEGNFTEEFRKEIPGTETSTRFFAAGISLVTHMHSPLIPTIHMNTRFIVTNKSWFGGGIDMTPTIIDKEDNHYLHFKLKEVCDKHNDSYYKKFSEECDKYFYIKHRKEARGIGGIFYDNLDTSNFDADFAFTKDIGNSLLDIYLPIVRKHMNKQWTLKQKEIQLVKRGRYVEFNLIYDRGTRFGLMTNANPEAFLMSLPPVVKWP